MKRVFTFLTLAAALVAVSCAKEQENPYEGGSMVTYTIDGPAQVATKAMGTIGTAYTLYYEVRLWDGSVLGNKLEGTGLSGSKVIAANAWPTTVSFDLARGKQYKILFWAQSNTAPAGLYDCSDLTAIAIDYSQMAASNEDCDAFYGSDVIIPAGATSAAATLQRPFALVNLGTSDAAQFHTASGGCTVGDVKVTINGSLANSFNVATGEPGAGVATNFAPIAAPIDAYDAKTLVVGETSFNYLSAVYVLPAGASDVIEVAYDIKDNATTPADITSLTVSNVPVKANHRTNITGKLLTGATTYNIDVDQAFAGNTNKVVGPSFATLADLNTYLSNMQEGTSDGDNGDINPEQVVLTAMGAVTGTPKIVLPKIHGDVDIRLAFEYDGTVDMVYAEGATDAQKPANIFFYAQKLNTLQATVPASHFELLSGSVVTNKAIVSTNTTTFVIQNGAKVGTAEIQKGNANIAGTVGTVSVPTGATADGTNPVQVFLEKVSSVEKIELAAKTDVVVEQPKDQITKDETERKVAVYVKEGADNSTAKAQNGGVIYVKADVPCTVTVDGTSEAKDGSAVSSTVIIDSGAGGSTVTAENGGAINLTANDNCEVTASGSSTPEDPTETPVPSTVTIAEVGTDATVYTETSEGGEVEEAPDAEIHGDVFAYVALNVNTEVQYISLKAAIDAASAGDTIKMTDNSTEKAAITANKSITVDLNEKTVNFADFEDTVPALLFYTEEQGIDVSISNGTLHGDGTVKWIVKYDAHGTLTMEDVVSNCAVANGQSIRIESGIGTLTDLNITTTNGSAGIYYCDSNTSGIATGAVTGCTINQQEASGGNAWWKCGIAISNGAKVTIDDCELTGNAPLFIFTSGGEFTVKDTEFHGLGGDYGAYDIVIESNQNAVPSIGLIYNDCTFSKESPVRMIAEGNPYAMAHYYVNAADDALIINSQADFTYAKAQEWPLLQLGNASGSFIDAGIFNNNPTACLAQDYKAVLDEVTGHYSVIPVVKNCVLYTPGIEPVLSSNQPDVEYPDSPGNYEVSFNGSTLFLQLNRTEVTPVEYALEDAVNSAQAGQVIRLTSDVTVGSLAIPADVAIDFAGHTLTADQLSCKTSGRKFILKQTDHTNPYKVSYVGELQGAEIRGGSYLFDPTDYTPNGVGVVIPGQGEYAGGYYVPSVPEPKVFYANNDIVQQLGGLTIGKIPDTNNNNGWVLMYNPDGHRYNPYNTIGIKNGLYAFQADFNENENTTNAYEDWYADYVVYYDKAVNYEQKEIQEWDALHTYDCPTAGLWGSYGGMTYAILMGENVPANYKCPLLGMVNWGWEYWRIRSDVKTFLCGPTNHSMANVGTTATVELRLYKSQPTMEGINAPGFKDYIVVGRYVHPLDDPSLTPATGN